MNSWPPLLGLRIPARGPLPCTQPFRACNGGYRICKRQASLAKERLWGLACFKEAGGKGGSSACAPSGTEISVTLLLP